MQREARYEVVCLKVGRVGFPNFVYLVVDSLTLDSVLFDPGWEHSFILGFLVRNNLSLRAVFLTHSHQDHVASAAPIARYMGCEVVASECTSRLLNGLCCVDYALLKDEHLVFGSIGVKAILTPGHTACSVCYAVDGALFSGDTLFIEGCGLVASPGGNPEEIFFSLQKLKNIIPQEARVFPGHQYKFPVGTTFGSVKTKNIYMRLSRLDDFVRFIQRPVLAKARPPLIGTVPCLVPELDYTFAPRIGRAMSFEGEERRCQA